MSLPSVISVCCFHILMCDRRVSLPKTTHLHRISVFIKATQLGGYLWGPLKDGFCCSLNIGLTLSALEMFSLEAWDRLLFSFRHALLCHLDPEQAFLWTVAWDPLVLSKALQTLSGSIYLLRWSGSGALQSFVASFTMMKVFYWTFHGRALNQNRVDSLYFFPVHAML